MVDIDSCYDVSADQIKAFDCVVVSKAIMDGYAKMADYVRSYEITEARKVVEAMDILGLG